MGVDIVSVLLSVLTILYLIFSYPYAVRVIDDLNTLLVLLWLHLLIDNVRAIG